MSLFVQQHNGNIRRVRGTFGGGSAWKQHEDNSGWDDPTKRRRLIEQIQDKLAMEQLRDALAGRDFYSPHNRRGRNNNTRRQAVSAVAQPVVAEVQPRPQAVNAVAQPVVAKVPPRPRFKAQISESGKIVAVLIN
jgi:hypothetical protein